MRIAVLVPSMLIISVATLAGATADGQGDPPLAQVRLMMVHNPVYEVEETASGGSLPGSTEYVWQDEDPGALGVAMQYLRPCGIAGGRPLLWGFELQYQHAEVEPDSYTSGGSSFLNSNHETFSYGALSAGAVLAWRFAQPTDSSIGVIGEFQVMLGVTVLSGSIRDDLGESDGAIGYGIDGCARVLLGLQESGWMGAISAGLRGGFASIDVDHGSYTSALDLERNGLEIAFIIGRDL